MRALLSAVRGLVPGPVSLASSVYRVGRPLVAAGAFGLVALASCDDYSSNPERQTHMGDVHAAPAASEPAASAAPATPPPSAPATAAPAPASAADAAARHD